MKGARKRTASRPARRGASPQGPLEREARALLRESVRAIAKLDVQAGRAVAEAAELLIASFENGGTAYFCGNGGSAADAQHLACELSGRYLMDRPALPAVALSTNSSSVTAIGNDFGYDFVFSRQLEGLATPGDVLVAITTSGNSVSVLNAADVARRCGMAVIGMTGAKGAKLVAKSDVALVTPSTVTPNIQEGHIMMGHAFCNLVERALFAGRIPAAAKAGRTTPKRRGATGRAR